MKLKTVLPVFVAVAVSAVSAGNSWAATIQYDISGNYTFDSLPPGFPLAGTFDWNANSGLGDWNITLSDFPAGTLTDNGGGQGAVTGRRFEFQETDLYAFGSQQFIMTGTFKGLLPSVIGERTTFTGTFVNDISLTGVPTFENLFTVSGTIAAARFVDAPEPASFALAGLGVAVAFWFAKRRFAAR